jgi:nucleoside-diphosphate-sugar epimerase
VRVLVTGLGGFIGSHLGRLLLERGDEVHAIVRPGDSLERLEDLAGRIDLIEADLSDVSAYRPRLLELRPECAFHAAWYTRHGLYWKAPENLSCVGMTLSLARALNDAGCRQLVCVGSCAEYDWTHGTLVEERTPTEPDSLYGVAKNATRMILEAWAQETDLDLSWARIFFPFGPGEAEPRLIPSVARSLLAGEPVRCSHGRQIRDFMYVEDCARALLAIADARLTGCVNVGRGEPVEIRWVVETLARLAGRGIDAVKFGSVPADPLDPPMVVADARRLREEAHWSPVWGLEEALAETLRWWRKRA